MELLGDEDNFSGAGEVSSLMPKGLSLRYLCLMFISRIKFTP